MGWVTQQGSDLGARECEGQTPEGWEGSVTVHKPPREEGRGGLGQKEGAARAAWDRVPAGGAAWGTQGHCARILPVPSLCLPSTMVCGDFLPCHARNRSQNHQVTQPSLLAPFQLLTPHLQLSQSPFQPHWAPRPHRLISLQPEKSLAQGRQTWLPPLPPPMRSPWCWRCGQ